MDASTALEDIASSIRTCTACGLCLGRTNAVPGTGNPNADIVFIGEGPGKNEDEQGIPFCGASGKFLDSLLATINLNRSDIFITNIVKCRPPNNRDPLPDEKDICTDLYLSKQLDIINPKLIITLGRHALNYFIPNVKISQVHGQPKRHNGRVFLPLYHPAVALYNASTRETLEQDFLLIPPLVEKIRLLSEDREA
jgi:DNA polymerase